MLRSRTKEQKERDVEYHRNARTSGKTAKKTAEQKCKYAAALRLKRRDKEVRLNADEAEPQGKMENIEFSQPDQSAELLPAEIDEVEPDPTAWLDHVMDDPVLADDRNEGPNMYKFSKICLINIKIE